MSREGEREQGARMVAGEMRDIRYWTHSNDVIIVVQQINKYLFISPTAFLRECRLHWLCWPGQVAGVLGWPGWPPASLLLPLTAQPLNTLTVTLESTKLLHFVLLFVFQYSSVLIACNPLTLIVRE